MSVNTQVSGNKIHTIQASKNLGTVTNTQVSGDKVNATHEYRKITNVQPTQVSGERHLTNYTGINSEGTNIFENKNTVNETEFFAQNVTNYTKKDMLIADANELIEEQEADKKHK